MRFAKYKRYDIALTRLREEHDIKRLITLNRVTQLIHKSYLNSRQRFIINCSRKYVISDHDIYAKSESEADQAAADAILAQLYEEFNPQTNKTDRRLLY